MIRFQQARGVGARAVAEKPSHRFTIDQTVRMKGRVGLARTTPELFHVKATLPVKDGSPQYRIRSDDESHDRVTTEDNLEAAEIAA